MLIGWVRPLFCNTCLCHFILVMDIVLWHWPPPNLQCHICHMFYDPLHAAVSLQIAHPRYLPLHAAGIRFSGCLCCHYLISTQCSPRYCYCSLLSVPTTISYQTLGFATSDIFLASSVPSHNRNTLSADLIPDWWWLDCWIVWLTVSCTVIGVIITSLVTPRDSVTVQCQGPGQDHVSRVT